MSVSDSAARSQHPFPDLIPGIIHHASLNILAGASGVGKTCLLATMLAQLAAGKEIFGTPCNTPPAIGYICADRGGATAQHWLTQAGSPLLTFYSLADDPLFRTVTLRHKFKLVEVLETCIDKLALPPGALVVVDPISLFLGNPNDYQGVAVACIEMRRAILKRDLTLIGTAHASKQKADPKAQYKRLQDRILGSAAQLGYADTQMYLASPEETDEKFYTFLWHPHTAPPQVFPIGRDQHGMFVDWLEGIQAVQEGKILAAITDTVEGTGFAEILITTEVPKTTAFRYLQELVKEGRVIKVGHGRYRRAPSN